MAVNFLIRSNNGNERTLTFDKHCIVMVGRSKECRDFQLPDDDNCSRRHMIMEIGINPSRCHIHDLCSKHGTYRNSVRIVDADIISKDKIKIGNSIITVFIDEEPASPASVENKITAPKMCLRCEIEYISDNHICDKCRQNMNQNETVPGYTIVKQIGSGGMADVYLVEHYQREEMLVLKECRFDYSSKQAEMFIKECETLKSLEHKNIIKYYTSYEYNKKLFMLMEFAVGKSLRLLCDDNSGKLNPDSVRNIFIQVLSALEYAHSENILHRDIKPENIMINGEYPDYKIKVLDFGIAKNLLSSGMTDLTVTNEIKGTYFYMAPEQIQHSDSLDYRVDIFAVGAAMYNTLTGKYAFDFPENALIPVYIDTILQENTIPIDERRNDIPEPLVKFITKAIEKERENRFQSIAQMKKELIEMKW